MSVHADLLEQAKHLAARERRRPKQTSLRRAVSSAYYALFHLLTTEACELIVADAELVAPLKRTLNHVEINRVCKQIVDPGLPTLPKALHGNIAGMVGSPSFYRLRDVAQALIDLQQARHEADYNLVRKFTRAEVTELIEQVEQAFDDWHIVRRSDYARLFLANFWLWDRWDKAR